MSIVFGILSITKGKKNADEELAVVDVIDVVDDEELDKADDVVEVEVEVEVEIKVKEDDDVVDELEEVDVVLVGGTAEELLVSLVAELLA
jgi:hypothetical protein